jgi:hypothetical protein
MNWYKKAQQQAKVYLERGGVEGNERYFIGKYPIWEPTEQHPVSVSKWGPIESAKDFFNFNMEVSKRYAELTAREIEQEEGFRVSVYIDEGQVNELV